MADTELHGASYAFGLTSTDVSGISIAGFTPRSITYDAEPEVFAMATNGEGHVEAVAMTLKGRRKLSASLVGYISTGFSSANVDNTFSKGGRNFFIKKISEPRRKGDFVEVTIDAESYFNVAN